MRGDDLQILMAGTAIAVVVLDSSIGETDVAIVVRQLVLTCPLRDLVWLAVRPSVAILFPSIALVQEPLVVPFELVVQDHAIYSPTLVAEPLLSAEVGGVDLRVVRQLAWLPEASMERLPRLPGAFLFAPIRFKEISATVGEDDSAVLRAQWRRAQQPLSFEVALASAGVFAADVKIALGHDAKCPNGGQHPAFSAVDLVDAIAFSHRPTLTPARQVEILRERLPRVSLVIALALTRAASAADGAVPSIVTIAVTVSDVESVPHVRLDLLQSIARHHSKTICYAEYRQPHNPSQPIVGLLWFA
jgi:hypothetical protein